MATGKKTTKKTGSKKAKARIVSVDAPQPAPPKDVAKPMDFKPALCIIGSSDLSLFGRTISERIREQFRRAGLTNEISETDLASHAGPSILVSAKGVLDQPLIGALLKRPNLAITSEKNDGGVVLAAHVRGATAMEVARAMHADEALAGSSLMMRAPSEMDANYWQALRKRETPYALPLSEGTLSAVEWRVFMGTYKGATDLVTKHVWPRPAFHVTRFLARHRVTPNMVTTVGAVMTVAAFYFFLAGQFGAGLVAAWLMTFLDTVDGKLARTSLTSSKWGDVFDHGIDLVHPPFWYFAWAYGLIFWGVAWSTTVFWGTMGCILGGYVVQRLMEGAAIKWLGMEIHIWRKIDTIFRQVTARRNPNLILLTLGYLGGKPDWGLLAVAVWTITCLALHGIQLAQGFAAKRKAPLQSWMTRH